MNEYMSEEAKAACFYSDTSHEDRTGIVNVTISVTMDHAVAAEYQQVKDAVVAELEGTQISWHDTALGRVLSAHITKVVAQ